ncbi:MAG: hypothetical protein RO469_05105 [Thermincola sp.]|jgi:hypothetical protein|nr:hypothetical protein [Thermincola sp.]MDT3702136.1 hypothetical protein [Thermincola sp.]
MIKAENKLMKISILSIVLIIAIVFFNRGNGIKIIKITKLENKPFNSILKEVVNKGVLDANKDIYIYEKFFGFSFNPDMTLKRFNFIFGTKDKDISFRLFYDSGVIHMKKNVYGNPTIKINLNSFFDVFDNINYDLILKSLKKGDRYSLNIYPENNLNNAGYIYNKENLFTKEIYVYSKEGLNKIAGNTVTFSQQTLLFSVSSMKITKKDWDSESFSSIDSIILIVPLEFITEKNRGEPGLPT